MAYLSGTYVKEYGSNPTFTQINNVVANCLIQATADGNTKLVVQMKSGYANELQGNFSIMVMGSMRLADMIVSAPGYDD